MRAPARARECAASRSRQPAVKGGTAAGRTIVGAGDGGAVGISLLEAGRVPRVGAAELCSPLDAAVGEAQSHDRVAIVGGAVGEIFARQLLRHVGVIQGAKGQQAVGDLVRLVVVVWGCMCACIHVCERV